MCGITGVWAFTEKGKAALLRIKDSVRTLYKRGPDGEGIFAQESIALGHRRLAVIDTSTAAAQPLTDATGRYTIVFNGEFFNFKTHRKTLESSGIVFKSSSDTEVLLYLFIKHGPSCIELVNGFFSFAVYDNLKKELFVFRDRYGIKPLLYYQDENIFAFASELKALLAFQVPRILDNTSLYTYLQLNYIPAPETILKGVFKLKPGHYLKIAEGQLINNCYYTIPYSANYSSTLTYSDAKTKLRQLLEESVQRRLISDVPLGCFLSGGIDSSIITALAAKHSSHLKTFSIGYKDEPLFDETKYARLVAQMHGTDHTVFSLGNNDLFENLYQVLDYLDEPFADSSALAVYILSKNTRKQVTVALSGDGADELFAGYNKHSAEYFIRNKGYLSGLLSVGNFFWNQLPKSRNSVFGNKIRQLQKLSTGASLSPAERYWLWAGYAGEKAVHSLLKSDCNESVYKKRKGDLLSKLTNDFNSVLLTDMDLVLQNDMLTKVDSMSMANSLEVRVPFLDFTVVDFAFSLPSKFKISPKDRKLILKDSLGYLLPPELLNREKQGFEVPLLKWFKTDLKSLITEDWLGKQFIEEQAVFHYPAIQQLLRQLYSLNPDEAVARVWALIVFQSWWKKYML